MTTREPDGADWARAELGRTLCRARETAGLTQAQLAEKLSEPVETIARFEAGEESPSERFVRRVLKACGLPPNWPAP